MERRVVITGMGAITPIGNDIQTYWNNLINGVCGIDYISSFPTDDLPVKIGGEIRNFNPAEHGIAAPFARKQDRFVIYAAAAANEAMAQSGLDSSEGGNIDPFRFGVYIGTGIGGFTTIYRETGKMIQDGAKWVAPTFVSTMIGNMASANVAILHKACGPSLCTTAACATSTSSIGEAYRAIRHGYADAILAGGTEAVLIPIGIAAFANSRALTRAEDPKYASLPFNANRGGFVLSEGAGVLVLEEYEHAKARGAQTFAELCGYGNTNDAHHVTAPNPTGETQAAAIRTALEEAGYTSSDVLHINSHGTGTSLNDPTETKAFKLALGKDAYKAHINSTKSMTGHLLGAAGAIEAIATVLALKNGIVPPTVNLDCPDETCDLDYTPNKACKADLTLAISNSLGFGGSNACVAFRKL